MKVKTLKLMITSKNSILSIINMSLKLNDKVLNNESKLRDVIGIKNFVKI